MKPMKHPAGRKKKLTPDQLLQMRIFYWSRLPIGVTCLAKVYGCSPSLVQQQVSARVSLRWWTSARFPSNFKSQFAEDCAVRGIAPPDWPTALGAAVDAVIASLGKQIERPSIEFELSMIVRAALAEGASVPLKGRDGIKRRVDEMLRQEKLTPLESLNEMSSKLAPLVLSLPTSFKELGGAP